MNYKITISEDADQDLIGASDYLSEQAGKDFAKNFINRFKNRTFKLLSVFPNSCAKKGNYRYFVFEKYITIYTVNNISKKVRIVMFVHHSRDYQSIIRKRV